MENEYNDLMYCKAGFRHVALDDCEHVVSQSRGWKFELPADFYSKEATAARKAENKAKYGPRGQLADRSIKRAVNEVRDVGDKELFDN
jgi:hypothetical protein